MKEIRRQISIGIADEQPIVASGLTHLLESQMPFPVDIRWVVHSGRTLMEHLRKSPVQLLITELKLSEIDGLDLIEQIKETYKQTRVLVLSQYQQQKFVKMAFGAGVDGFVLKSSTPADLIEGISEVIQGNVFMGQDVSLGPKQKVSQNGSARKKEFETTDRFKAQNDLTDREREILKKIGSGQSVKEIAADLFISDQTVSAHKRNMMRKFDVHSSRELVEKSRRHNILD